MERAFGARAFVLRECRLDSGARTPVALVGRSGGLFAWLKSLLGIDDSVVLEVSPSEISLTTVSLAGSLRESMPTVAVSNLGVGYLKPIGFVLTAVATLPVIGVTFKELLETSNSLMQARLAWQLAGAMAVFISAVAAYFLRKCVCIHVISRSGWSFQVAFSRSMVEGVPMDATTGQWIVDAFLGLKYNRPLRPLPTASARLSADRTRTGFLLLVSGVSAVSLGTALFVGWLCHDRKDSAIVRFPVTETPEPASKGTSGTVLKPENPVSSPTPKAIAPTPEVEEPLSKVAAPPSSKLTPSPTRAVQPPTNAVQPSNNSSSDKVDFIGAGLAALHRKDYPLALKLFGSAAEGGDPVAFNALGLMFRNGLGVEAGPEAAVVFFRAAGDRVPQANAELAACFEVGYGVRKSALVARSYYRLAMERGYSAAAAKVESLRSAAAGEEMEKSLLRAQEDLSRAESACAGSGYRPLEKAVLAIRRKASGEVK